MSGDRGKLTDADFLTIVGRLERARHETTAIVKVTDDFPGLDLDDAYRAQRLLRDRAIESGARLVGFKMGSTSPSKMKQMGMTKPVYGYLLDSFAVAHGANVRIGELIQPKVEPEIAFVMRHALRGPGCHAALALRATDFVLPAIEIIDSRYRNYAFDLPSVVADNTSSARFVLGSRPSVAGEIDLRTRGVVLEKNGEVVACGAGAAVLGHPAASVAALANLLHAQGEEIPAGAVVLTGGVTEAISVAAGDAISLGVQSLGSVSVRFE